MAQKRIVLPNELIPLADEICQSTGICNHSQLVALLIKNFGSELVARLKGNSR